MIGWIVGAFVAGEAIGLIIAAVIVGKMDDFMEWRKRKNEQKNISYYWRHHGGGAGSADRAEHMAGQPENMGRMLLDDKPED